jgi:hypothetical protein
MLEDGLLDVLGQRHALRLVQLKLPVPRHEDLDVESLQVRLQVSEVHQVGASFVMSE